MTESPARIKQKVAKALPRLRFPDLGGGLSRAGAPLSGFRVELRGMAVRVAASLSWEARGLESLVRAVLEETLAGLIPQGYRGAVHLSRGLPPDGRPSIA
jgi:hypothetical protein